MNNIKGSGDGTRPMTDGAVTTWVQVRNSPRREQPSVANFQDLVPKSVCRTRGQTSKRASETTRLHLA